MAVLAQAAPLPAKWPQVAQYRNGVAVPQVQDEALRYQRATVLQDTARMSDRDLRKAENALRLAQADIERYEIDLRNAHKRREHWQKEIWRLKGKRDDKT